MRRDIQMAGFTVHRTIDEAFKAMGEDASQLFALLATAAESGGDAWLPLRINVVELAKQGERRHDQILTALTTLRSNVVSNGDKAIPLLSVVAWERDENRRIEYVTIIVPGRVAHGQDDDRSDPAE